MLNKQKVKQILHQKNKSPTWLAYRCGVSISHINMLTSGDRNASPELRERLIEVLGDKEIFSEE
jgi:plasmid maintenance system antidote protein VapI